MPRKSENMRINNKKFDRRIKLTEQDRENIKSEHRQGNSIHSLAKKYNVSRRTIQFTLFSERKEKARQDYKERRKDGRYYNRDKHKEYMKNHRDYKHELYKDGKIK